MMQFDQELLGYFTSRYETLVSRAEWDQAKDPIPLIERLLSAEQVPHAVVKHPGTKLLVVAVQLPDGERHALHVQHALGKYLIQRLGRSVDVIGFKFDPTTTCALLVQWKTHNSVPRFVSCTARTDCGSDVDSFKGPWRELFLNGATSARDSLTLTELQELREVSIGVIPLFRSSPYSYTWKPSDMVRGYVNEIIIESRQDPSRSWRINLVSTHTAWCDPQLWTERLAHSRQISNRAPFRAPVDATYIDVGQQVVSGLDRGMGTKCDVCHEKMDFTSALTALVPHVDTGLSCVRAVSVGVCCQTKAKGFDLHHKNGEFVWTKKKTSEEERRERENRIVRFGENAPAGTYTSAWLCAVAALKETGLDWRSLTKEFMTEFSTVVLAFHRARLDGEPFEQACAKHKTYAPGDAVTKALRAYERARPNGVTVPSVRPVHRSLLTLSVDLDD